MKEKETEVILVSGGRRVAGANSKFKKKSPEYLEKQLSWKVAHVRESGYRGPGKFCRWNQESWALESAIQDQD